MACGGGLRASRTTWTNCQEEGNSLKSGIRHFCSSAFSSAFSDLLSGNWSLPLGAAFFGKPLGVETGKRRRLEGANVFGLLSWTSTVDLPQWPMELLPLPLSYLIRCCNHCSLYTLTTSPPRTASTTTTATTTTTTTYYCFCFCCCCCCCCCGCLYATNQNNQTCFDMHDDESNGGVVVVYCNQPMACTPTAAAQDV